MTKKRIFISHAVKDKRIADSLVDLLTSCGIVSPDECFCTSLEGLGVPAGKDFLEFIKDVLQSPDLVIAIFSVNYLSSEFCLCELGASWAMSHNLISLVVPPLTFNHLSTIIRTKQAVALNSSSDMNSMMTEVNTILKIENFNYERWEVKRDQFIVEFNNNLALVYEKMKLQKKVVDVEDISPSVVESHFQKMFSKATSEDEKTDVILLYLSEAKDFREGLDEIASAMSIKKVLCRYLLDKLLGKEFISEEWITIALFSTKQMFELTKSGRDYLVENGKL
jgi:hypothetical protein